MHRKINAVLWLGLALVVMPEPWAVAADDSAPATAEAPSTAEILERLRKTEELNQKLLKKFETLETQNQALQKQVKALSEKPKSETKEKTKDEGKDSAGGGGGGGGSGGAGRPSSDPAIRSGGVRRPEEAQIIGNRHRGKIPLKSSYDADRRGFGWESEDGELSLRIRASLQTDAVMYPQADQDPVHSGIYIPRARIYFQGRLTKPFEYQLAFQRGFSNIDLLNAFLNYTVDDRFRVRFGRFKAPYTYEWYKLNTYQMIAPERSLYSNNFGLNRMLGVMAWGELFGRKLEYAVGAFDGPRNSVQDFNNAKDVVAFFNYRPFDETDSAFKNLNMGGSLDYGQQNNPLTPAVLRTTSPATSTAINGTDPVNNASVPFMAFNNNVREKGLRALWEIHLAYYYKALSLLAAWESGFDSYGLAGASNPSIRVPIGGYFVQAAYLLTGETLNERAFLDPRRPFDLRKGKRGPGAWEVHARFSELQLGNQVFSAGFADKNLWTNQASTIDVGVNWYLNHYVKVMFDWQHAMFGEPVMYKPGPGLQSTSDLFWIRMLLYF